MKPEQLINNAAFRALVNRGGFFRARQVIRATVLPLVVPRQRRATLRQRVKGHLQRCFPEADADSIAEQLRAFEYHWGCKFAEDCIAVNVDTLERYRRWVEQLVTFEHPERLSQALERPGGVLVVSCHLGSISFCTNALLSLFLQIPKEQWPSVRLCAEPEVERFPAVLQHVQRALDQYGGDVQFILAGGGEGGVAAQMTETLERGGLVTTNLDVVHGGTSDKVFELLGLSLFLPSLVGAARVALRAGATVLPFVSRRTAEGFTITLERPLPPLPQVTGQIPDEHPELEALCATLRVLLERWIAAAPEQWVYWDRLHKRLARPTP